MECDHKRLKKSPPNSSTTIKNQPQDQDQDHDDDDQESHNLTTPSSSSTDLPWSIMIDILARLPLKTLINCRHVCKSWRSFLHESYFHKLYSLHSPTALIIHVKPTSLHTLTQFFLLEPSSSSSSCINININISININMPSNFRFQVGNGCNGLVCLREIPTREPGLVWNPIMGQFVVLPKPATTSIDKVVAGFGFCRRTNRYKVVRIFRGLSDPPSSRWRVEILDLCLGGQWRGIGYAPAYPIPSRIPGFYTHNSLHWILDNNGSGSDSDSDLICGFDFVEENFKVISPPPIFTIEEKNKYRWSNIGIIVGCLSICAIDTKPFRPDVQVWVMEEYGVVESWVLKLSIADPIVHWWDPYKWIQVTNFVDNGEILMLCAHYDVLSYNLREREFQGPETLDFPAIAHVPSFVSLEDVVGGNHGEGSMSVRYL